MYGLQALLLGVHDEVIEEVDGLLVVFHGQSLVEAVEPRKIIRVHEGGGEPVNILGEASVVTGVGVPDHNACNKDAENFHCHSHVNQSINQSLDFYCAIPQLGSWRRTLATVKIGVSLICGPDFEGQIIPQVRR